MSLHTISGRCIGLKFYCCMLINILVLDPCISYEALKNEFTGDVSLLNQLETAKSGLFSHFKTNYSLPSNASGSACLPSTLSSSMISVISDSSNIVSQSNAAGGSPQKNFMARSQRRCTPIDKLSEFWSFPQEDFQHCDPVQWWYGRHNQFPDLYCLAHNIFLFQVSYSNFSFSNKSLIFVRICCCGRAHFLRWPEYYFSPLC